jgi:hypothetical protein
MYSCVYRTHAVGKNFISWGIHLCKVWIGMLVPQVLFWRLVTFNMTSTIPELQSWIVWLSGLRWWHFVAFLVQVSFTVWFSAVIYSLVFCNYHEALNSVTRGHMDFQLALCLLQVPCCVHAWRQITARERSCSERYAVLLHSYLLIVGVVLWSVCVFPWGGWNMYME